MLGNQDAVPEPQISVSQARVTPEELTSALAAIEARRQAEASRLADTIPIDQAVSELHLDSTSDEIWAEVKAQRAKATAAQPKQVSKTQEALLQPLAPRQRKPRAEWMAMFTPILIGWVLIQTGVIPHFWNSPRHHTAAPLLRPLAQVPDGQEVYADDSALEQVSKGNPLPQITVSENASGNRWTLVKMGGHIYLRGYVARTDSLQQLQGHGLNVYNDDNSGELEGEKTSNITLRVDKTPLQKSGGDGDYSEVTVPIFQPDPLTTLSPWH